MSSPESRSPDGADEIVERAVREHAALVYRVARAVLRDHHDAEDAAQEVFLRVLRLRRGLEGVRNERTWLARVAFRVALDRRARPRHVSLDDAAASRAVETLPAPEAAADEVAAGRQVRALVAEKVAALPGDLRHAVKLSTVAGLTSPEIAEVLGIPEGTVRTRLMRARRMLRVALAAALALLLAAAGGILLRRRENGEKTEIALKGGAPAGGAAPNVSRASAPGGREHRTASRAATRSAASSPSKQNLFPSPVSLSPQEKLLLAWVTSVEPGTSTALSGFLDEPAALPPLPDEPPSLNE